MNKKGIGLIIILIAIAVGIFYLTLGGKEKEETSPVGDINEIVDIETSDHDSTDGALEDTNKMPVAHTFIEGKHGYVGEINLPTPCHELSYEVIVAKSLPEQVTIAFTIDTEAEMCAQVITPEPFAVSFDASEEAKVNMTLNGNDLAFYVIEDKTEAPASDEVGDENIDDVPDNESEVATEDENTGTTTGTTTTADVENE